MPGICNQPQAHQQIHCKLHPSEQLTFDPLTLSSAACFHNSTILTRNQDQLQDNMKQELAGAIFEADDLIETMFPRLQEVLVDAVLAHLRRSLPEHAAL